MQLVKYVKIYCVPGKELDEIKAMLTVALNSLVAQNLIWHSTADGVQAAAEAFCLSDQDINLLKGIVVSKITYTVSSGTLNSTIPYHSEGHCFKEEEEAVGLEKCTVSF